MKFSELGFEILPDFMSLGRIKNILGCLERERLDLNVTGIRHIDKKLTAISDYLASIEFLERTNDLLSANHKLVRAILFNKTSETNWYVTWHQDRTVSVSNRFDDQEWKCWGTKEGVLHVQPPLAVLDSMVTIRIHLDNANRDNGCLQVISGSHQYGLLSQEKINEIVKQEEFTYCEVKAGDAVILRPLLLHSSSKSINPTNRRVLHLEFSNWILPDGIDWA